MKHKPPRRRVRVRLFVPLDAWAYFEYIRDAARRRDPGASILSGDVGAQQVLRSWIEGHLRRLAEEVG